MNLRKILLIVAIFATLTYLVSGLTSQAFDVDNMIIRKIGSNKCIKVDNSEDIKLSLCNNMEASQTFTITNLDDGNFGLKNGVSCLELNKKKNCTTNTNQRFKKSGWQRNLIKNIQTEECLANNPFDGTESIILNSCNDSNTFAQFEVINKADLTKEFEPSSLYPEFRENVDPKFIKNIGTNTCLDFENPQSITLLNIQFKTCDSNKTTQKLIFEAITQDTFLIRNGNLCLNSIFIDGIREVQSWYCDYNSSQQQWSYKGTKKQYIGQSTTNTCFNLKNITGSKLTLIKNCNERAIEFNKPEYKFEFTSYSTLNSVKNDSPANYYRRLGTNKCITIDPLAKAILATCSNDKDTRLINDYYKDNSFVIKDQTSQMCIASATPIQMATCNPDSPQQQWESFENNKIRNITDLKCIGNYDTLPDNGSLLYSLDCNSTNENIKFDNLQLLAGKLERGNNYNDPISYQANNTNYISIRKKGTNNCILYPSQHLTSKLTSFSECTPFDLKQKLTLDRLASTGDILIRNDRICMNQSTPVNLKVCSLTETPQRYKIENNQIISINTAKCLTSDTPQAKVDTGLMFNTCGANLNTQDFEVIDFNTRNVLTVF